MEDSVKLEPLGRYTAIAREKVLVEMQNDWNSKYLEAPLLSDSNNLDWVDFMLERKMEDQSIKYYSISYAKDYSGEIAIDAIDHQTGIANVFYWVRPCMRGRGIAPRAIQLLREELKGQQTIRYLQFAIDRQNRASIAAARKAGAIHYSLLPGLRFKRDCFRQYYFLKV